MAQAKNQSEHALSDTDYRTLFESIDEGVCVVQMLFDEDGKPRDYRFLEINPRFEYLTGLVGALGKTARELVPDLDDFWFETYGRVAISGQPVRFESYAEAMNRWFDVHASPIGDPKQNKVALVFTNTTERKLIEAALRRSEARQTFLLLLNDTLRPLADPVAIQAQAARVLGEHLGVSRVHYGEIEANDEYIAIRQDYTNGVRSLTGRLRLDDFGPSMIAQLRAGRSLVVSDVAHAPELSEAERKAYVEVDVAAQIVVPLVKANRLVAVMGAHQSTPRAWTGDEVELIEQTAERTWAAVERERVQSDLRASEARFRAVQETSIDGFMVLESVRDEAGHIIDFRWTYANTAAEQIVGKPRSWFLGRRLLEGMSSNRLDSLYDAYVRVVETGEPWTQEFTYQHEGLEVYIRLVAAKAGDGFATSFVDLSERRHAEERIRESEERFRTLATTIPQLIWTAKPDGNVDYLTGQWAEYIGLPPERLYDWGWEQVVHPDDLANTLRDWTRCIQSGEPLEIRHRFRYHTGEWRWQLVRGLAIKDEAGQVTKWVGTCTDIHADQLRDQDERFLSELGERMRLADNPDALLGEVVAATGDYLQAARCYFGEMFESEDRWSVRHDFHSKFASISGDYHLSAYDPEILNEMRSSGVMAFRDAMTDPRTAASYEIGYKPFIFAAMLWCRLCAMAFIGRISS